MRSIGLAVAVAFISGCSAFLPRVPATDAKQGATAASIGELESGYTYVPVDPLPVSVVPGLNCRPDAKSTPADLLDSLPDNAVRMLVEQFRTSGAVTYGVAKAGAKDESYRVTIDYVNADTVNVPIWVAKYAIRRGDGDRIAVDPFSALPAEMDPTTVTFAVSRTKPTDDPFRPFINLPVYVGVGLRISATVHVTAASANISGIGVIGAEAEADRLKGSLVVQTLGVNGKSIAAALPIQSELNRTTAQNAIVAVGAIKALLYAEETVKAPRIVGFYLPFPGGKPLVNALISELSRDERLKWEHPCKNPEKKAGPAPQPGAA